MKYGISERVGMAIAAGLFFNAAIGLANLVKATSANSAPQPKVMAVYLSDKTGKQIQSLPVVLTTKDGTALATQNVGITQTWSGLPTTIYVPAIRTVSEASRDTSSQQGTRPRPGQRTRQGR